MAIPPGTSRFKVIYGKLSGSRKQRAKGEGLLSVGYHSSALYDVGTRSCLMTCRGTGLLPNRLFNDMQRARRGADWTAGTSVKAGGFEMLIEEVMELHLIPYEEGYALPPLAVSASTVTRQRAAPLTSPPTSPPVETEVAAAVQRQETDIHCKLPPTLVLQPSSILPLVPQTESALSRSTSLLDASSGDASGRYCLPRKRRRSDASLAEELQQCYPHFFQTF